MIRKWLAALGVGSTYVSARWLRDHARVTSKQAQPEGVSWDWASFLKNGGWK